MAAKYRGFWEFADATERDNTGTNDGLATGDLSWVQSTETWEVCQTVAAATSTWANASGIASSPDLQEVTDNGNTTTNSIDLTGAAAAITMGDGTGAPSISIDKGAASSAVWLDALDAGVRRWQVTVGADEDISFDRYNGAGVFQDTPLILDSANGDLAMGVTGRNIDISALNVRMTGVASPSLQMGDGSGGPNIILAKGAANNASILVLRDSGTAATNNRWIFQFASDEDIQLLRRDLSGGAAGTPLRFDWATGNVIIGEGAANVDIPGDLSVNDFINLTERAVTVAPAAGDGRFWVRNDVPNVAMFTDDAGTDWVLNGAGGTLPVGTTTDGTLRWSGAAWVESTLLRSTAAGDLTLNATSPAITVGTGAGNSQVELTKGAGNLSTLLFSDAGAAAQGQLFLDSNEDFFIEASGPGGLTGYGTLNLRTGDASDGDTSALNITTGTATGASGSGGDISIAAGFSAAIGQGGDVTIASGRSGSLNGGAVNVTTGNGGINRAGGNITLSPGDGDSGGSGGAVAINPGDGGSTGAGGAFSVTTGAGGATSGASGAVLIQTGTNTNASGAITIATGAGGSATFADDSGGLNLLTGDAASGEAGDITLTAGESGGDNGGNVVIQTSDSTAASGFDTGDIFIRTGENTNVAGGNSGDVNIQSGDQNNGQASGDVLLFSGSVTGTTAASGDTLVSTGFTSGNGNPGSGRLRLETGQNTSGALVSATGDIDISTGQNAGSGGSAATGDINITTGNMTVGTATVPGSINLTTGTNANSTRNTITMLSENIDLDQTYGAGVLQLFHAPSQAVTAREQTGYRITGTSSIMGGLAGVGGEVPSGGRVHRGILRPGGDGTVTGTGAIASRNDALVSISRDDMVIHIRVVALFTQINGSAATDGARMYHFQGAFATDNAGAVQTLHNGSFINGVGYLANDSGSQAYEFINTGFGLRALSQSDAFTGNGTERGSGGAGNTVAMRGFENNLGWSGGYGALVDNNSQDSASPPALTEWVAMDGDGFSISGSSIRLDWSHDIANGRDFKAAFFYEYFILEGA